MRLLFISNVYPSPLHPTKGVFNGAMVDALAELGHQVSVVCPIAWTDRVRAPRAAEGGGSNSRVDATFPTYFYTPRVLRSVYGWFMWQGIRRRVRGALAAVPPDAVLGYWAHPDGRCAIRAAREAGVPAVVMVGGSDVLLLTMNASRRRLVFEVLRDADAIVAVSEDIRGKVIEAGVSSEKVHVVRRGIDRCRFSPGDQRAARERLSLPQDRPMILWAGRMTPVKGLPVLIDAVDRVRERRPDVQVCLVGGGVSREAFASTIRARGLDGCFRLVGSVAHVRLADWYCAADLTVLPSYSEGVPNVLLESIACGTPFVASDVGGVSEIATPGLDTLIPSGDPGALADAMELHLERPRVGIERTFEPPSLADAARRLTSIIEALRGVDVQRASHDAAAARLETAAIE